MSAPVLGRLVGAGKEAEVFEYGTNVVKLYKPTAPKRSAFREAAALALVESLELPTPAIFGVVQIDARWGIVMARADGPSFADTVARQPALLPAYLREMASLHVRIHGHLATHFASLTARLAANIRRAETVLGDTRQRRLLDGLTALPEGRQLCHGDFHPFNILGPPGGALVIDWLDACSGTPAADVCRSYVLMSSLDIDLAAVYVAAYAEVTATTRHEIFRWLPFIAAARLAEGVPDEVDALLEIVDRGEGFMP